MSLPFSQDGVGNGRGVVGTVGVAGVPPWRWRRGVFGTAFGNSERSCGPNVLSNDADEASRVRARLP
jgi:hypothetical protein